MGVQQVLLFALTFIVMAVFLGYLKKAKRSRKKQFFRVALRKWWTSY